MHLFIYQSLQTSTVYGRPIFRISAFLKYQLLAIVKGFIGIFRKQITLTQFMSLLPMLETLNNIFRCINK